MTASSSAQAAAQRPDGGIWQRVKTCSHCTECQKGTEAAGKASSRILPGQLALGEGSADCDAAEWRPDVVHEE